MCIFFCITIIKYSYDYSIFPVFWDSLVMYQCNHCILTGPVIPISLYMWPFAFP